MKILSKELISQYDMIVRRYHYIRSQYYLDTNKGRFILRKADMPKEQLIFSQELDTYLDTQQFMHRNKIIPTRKKTPYAIYQDGFYIMQTYEEGQETDFKDKKDLMHILWLLAEFHKHARGMQSNVKPIETANIRNMYDFYNKRMIQHEKLKKRIENLKQKSRFEIMFLENCDHYEMLAQMAIHGVNKKLGQELIDDVKKQRTIAHRNYTYHAVIKTPKDYKITQLDTCKYDLQMIDVANILNKIMQKNNWDVALLYELISTYDKYNPIMEKDFQLLKTMLMYPEKYDRICLKYVASKRRWNYNMFEQKWETMLSYRINQCAAAHIIEAW